MSEQTGEVLDANAARVWKCLTACEGMVNPVAEIARLREDSGFLESYRTVAASKEADLREALDALANLLSHDAIQWANDCGPPDEGWQSDELVAAMDACEAVLAKHGRAA